MEKFREAKRGLSKMEMAAIEETLAPLIEINGNGDEMVETIRDFLIAAFNNREEMDEEAARKLAAEIFDNSSYAIICLASPNERVRFSDDLKRFFEARHSASPYLDEDKGYYLPVIEARVEENFTALDRASRGRKKEVEVVLANWAMLGREGREKIISQMYGEAVSDFLSMFAQAAVVPGKDFEFGVFFNLGEGIIQALVHLDRGDITDVKLISEIFIDKAREFFKGRYNALVVKVVPTDIH